MSRNVGNGKAGKLIIRQQSVAIRVHSRTGRSDERKGFYNVALVFYYKNNVGSCIQSHVWKSQNKTWKTTDCSTVIDLKKCVTVFNP